MKPLAILIFIFVSVTAIAQDNLQENLELIIKDLYNAGQLPKEHLQESDSLTRYSFGREYIAILVTEENNLELEFDTLNGYPSVHFLTGEYLFLFNSKYWIRTMDVVIDEEVARIKYITHASGFSVNEQERKCYSGMVKARKLSRAWRIRKSNFKQIDCSRVGY